jgi:exo-1,4-beta-D-glucosaminidase
MFEAFQINKKNATGIIQWMLNSAWPEMYWQLYDSFLMPNGAYYGAKKANEPVQLIFNYGDKAIYLNNNTFTNVENCTASVKIFDIISNIIFEKNFNVGIKSESSDKILELPNNLKLTETYFLDLKLYDFTKKEVCRNFYWLSSVEDILDYEVKVEDWPYYTPSKQYSDFKLLSKLPKVELNMKVEKDLTKGIAEIHIENNNDDLAFFVELLFFNKYTNEVILPIFWSDNYISLLPNEKRIIHAQFKDSLKIKNTELKLKGWNLK